MLVKKRIEIVAEIHDFVFQIVFFCSLVFFFVDFYFENLFFDTSISTNFDNAAPLSATDTPTFA